MEENALFRRCPELKEVVLIIRHEIQQAQRPAHEVILTDDDVLKLLKISKRKLAHMKANRMIPYSRLRPYSPYYYLLADILEWINSNRTEALNLKKLGG